MFARATSQVSGFKNRHKILSAKLLKQCYRYQKLRKTFSNFFRRHSELMTKYNVGLKILRQELEIYDDLVCELRRIKW